MLKYLRLYYNYFLVKRGFRKVLPAYFVNRIEKAGFVNYPLEWWHFCYGNKMYAAYKFEKKAIYGKAAIPWQPDLFKTE